ncbi:hypothetical protein D9757_004583 [Collybiopsis confluens]|uniref:SNF2 N-terminal domain-containing protein n=1 Tax=Collybiopsis confluens TaxID=2823264 RepID=A0A8H5HSN9_9AGAR|nr:hypothetical protein D9757_004583 [Collybiopsis confluens]
MAGSITSQPPPAQTPSLSSLSLSVQQHNLSNDPIDLTGDSDDEEHYVSPRMQKRMRVDEQSPRNGSVFASRSPSRPAVSSSSTPTYNSTLTHAGHTFDMNPSIFTSPHPLRQPPDISEMYKPPFAGPSNSSAFFPPRLSSNHLAVNVLPTAHHASSKPSTTNVIDLTGSPSPPPQQYHFQNGNHLPPDLDARTAICIGQLSATALVLYPIPYIIQEPGMSEHPWVPVRLQRDPNPKKIEGSETIHIKIPSHVPVNDVCDSFGVVEHKVATSLGGLLGKGLIRIEAKVRRGPANLPILPLQMMVYTPKGNISAVGPFMLQNGLLLDHPTPPYDLRKYHPFYYFNPHNPPVGGHNRMSVYPTNNVSRWTNSQVSAKSVEVQRSQIDEVFKSIKGGDQLAETEAGIPFMPTIWCTAFNERTSYVGPEIAAKLYPHQKKALTFLLEREREKMDESGNFSSLWKRHRKPTDGQEYWVHAVTQTENFEEPQEAKGAILADDMGLGKTITCVSLIAATLQSAKVFSSNPIDKVDAVLSDPDSASFSGSVWGMPDPAASSAKAKAKAQRMQERLASEFVRASRIKTKSRATLIICPLSTVANWEDQFREHWKGEVHVFGGAGGQSSSNSCPTPTAGCSSTSGSSSYMLSPLGDAQQNCQVGRVREGTPLRVYVYHGNARRPDPTFLADFDAVLTTYATLASEYSKQTRSVASVEAEEEEEDSDADSAGGIEIDEHGNQTLRLPKPKKGTKRKKPIVLHANEATSALQSIHWFRVVLDEAQ